MHGLSALAVSLAPFTIHLIPILLLSRQQFAALYPYDDHTRVLFNGPVSQRPWFRLGRLG